MFPITLTVPKSVVNKVISMNYHVLRLFLIPLSIFFKSSISFFCFMIVYFCLFRIFYDFFKSKTKLVISFSFALLMLYKFFKVCFDSDSFLALLLFDLSFFYIFILSRSISFLYIFICPSFSLTCDLYV